MIQERAATHTNVIADELGQWASRESADAPMNDVAALREQLQTTDVPDYAILGAAFVRDYQLVNFHKAHAALTALEVPAMTRVVDLGCGAGASSIAALAYLADHLPPNSTVECELVDRSKEQLTRARRAVEAVQPHLPLAVKIQYTQSDLPYIAPSPVDGGSLVLASHLVTENLPCADKLLRLGEDWAGPGGAVVVIERTGDHPSWKAIEAFARGSLATRVAGEAAILYPGAQRPWNTRWLMLEPARRPVLAAAAARYFNAWRSQDPSLLGQVFTPDARYQDKPFQAPVAGLSAIQGYWHDHVIPQQQLSISLHHVAYSNRSVHIEWDASFTRDGIPRSIQGTMVLDVDPATGLVRELREYYRSAPTEAVCDSERGHR